MYSSGFMQNWKKSNINEFIGMILQVLQMPDKSGRKFKGSGEYNLEQ